MFGSWHGKQIFLPEIFRDDIEISLLPQTPEEEWRKGESHRPKCCAWCVLADIAYRVPPHKILKQTFLLRLCHSQNTWSMRKRENTKYVSRKNSDTEAKRETKKHTNKWTKSEQRNELEFSDVNVTHREIESEQPWDVMSRSTVNKLLVI